MIKFLQHSSRTVILLEVKDWSQQQSRICQQQLDVTNQRAKATSKKSKQLKQATKTAANMTQVYFKGKLHINLGLEWVKNSFVVKVKAHLDRKPMLLKSL